MKSTLTITLLLLLVACVPSPKVENKTTTGNINASAPYLWSDADFPKTLQISNDYDNDEVTNIEDMSEAWKTALEDQVTFFDYGARISDTSSGLGNLDDLYDGVMGVYKTTTWPVDLPSTALAITQIFGRRYNVGDGDEFVNIEHADILVNYEHFDFDTADSGSGYDLRTVLLHEMGHFLGLQHNTSVTREHTVMYPSINSSEAKREPKSVDIAEIADKYLISISSGASSAIVAQAQMAQRYEIKRGDSGEGIKILLELHSDGNCIHKHGSTEIMRHRVEIQRKNQR